ncbi:MAG TPA: polysaccharide biosynthesis/export family protein [Rhizomicrobium sp.]|nr:polysaccharide biosynthesis/export family protein [Rhizomicrobium sp.]
MGRTVSLFLTRAAGILLAGMLLFAAFNHAHAQTSNSSGGSQTVGNQAGDDYGLKRFSGDNYDILPPGAGIAPPPSPQGYAPVAGSSVSANGYYSTLSTNPAQAQQQPQAAPPQQAYQPAPQAPMPQQQQAAAPAPEDRFGYKPLPPPVQAAPAYQPTAAGPAMAVPQQQQPAAPDDRYGYRPLPPVVPTAPQYPQGRTAAANPNIPPQPSYAARPGYDYVLGAGDKLRLTVYGEPDLSGDFAIDGSGFARLPLIGQVRAAGYTSQQLESVITSALARGYLRQPRVSVEVTTYRPFYIIGAVNRPGQYPYVDHMTALNAVALAGGFTSGAVESVVFVRREGSNREEELPADRTTQIYPGDVVRVHNTIFTDAMNLFAPFSGVAASAATAAVIQ